MRALVEGIRDIISGQSVDEQAVASLVEVTRESMADLCDSALCSMVKTPGRYLCFKDPEHGFVVMLMVWGAGDETPIHDHGCWGVEAILRGELLVTNYTESEVDPQPVGSKVLRAGQVMCNMPPDRDVHRVSNPTDDISISIHIYGQEMSKNRQFIPGEGFVACSLKTNCLEMPREFGLQDLQVG